MHYTCIGRTWQNVEEETAGKRSESVEAVIDIQFERLDVEADFHCHTVHAQPAKNVEISLLMSFSNHNVVALFL